MSTVRSVLAVAVMAASALAVSTAHAAEGCGPNGWRGSWGHCHYAPPVYVAPRPVIYAAPPVSAYACPPGYWLGPWGHCRDTPYHGRLPNGGWQ
jgi:hypothetical protein